MDAGDERTARTAAPPMTSEPTAEAACAHEGCGESEGARIHDPKAVGYRIRERHPFKPREEPSTDAVAAARETVDGLCAVLLTRFDQGMPLAEAAAWLDRIKAAAQAEAPRVAELEAALREIRDIEPIGIAALANAKAIAERALAPSAEEGGG